MTWLMRSTFFCMFLKSGIAMRMTTTRNTTMMGRITAKLSDSGLSWRSAMMMPPMPIMGAKMSSERPRTTIICTCCTSLVPRVMSEGVPNRLTSAWEKLSTLRKRLPRTSRPKLMAALAAM